MGTQYSAKNKIRDIEITVARMERDLSSTDEKKLIAQFCIIHGSTERTAKNIINMFINAGRIKRIGKELVCTEHYEELMGKVSENQETLLKGA